jgi:hypothetical protein
MNLPSNVHEKKRDKYSPTSWDVIVVVCILVFTVAVAFEASLMALQAPSGKKTAFVYGEGVLMERLDLGTNQDVVLLEGKMKIRVQDGRIAVVETDCPRKVCMHIGWIRHPGETIICAPFKIAVQIEASGEPSVDAVVF